MESFWNNLKHKKHYFLKAHYAMREIYMASTKCMENVR